MARPRKYKLPTREWYNVEETCKLIEEFTGKSFTLADLFYFCTEQELVLYSYVTANSGKDSPFNGEGKLGNISFSYSDVFIVENDPNNIDASPFGDDDNNPIYPVIKRESRSGIVIFNSKFKNLWINSWVAIAVDYRRLVISEMMKNNGLLIDKTIFLHAFDFDFSSNVDVWIRFTFGDKSHNVLDFSTIFLRAEDINDFLLGKNKRKYIKNSIALCPFYDDINQNWERGEKPVSGVVASNQTKLIKALLSVNYKIETPQDARNAMGEYGALRMDIESYNKTHYEKLKLSDKTLYNWLSKL